MTMQPEPAMDLDGTYTVMAKKWTGRYWFALELRVRESSSLPEALVVRHIENEWENFETGTLIEMRKLFDGLPNGTLEPEEELDLGPEPPSPYADLAHFGRF